MKKQNEDWFFMIMMGITTVSTIIVGGLSAYLFFT
jgi:hypothetical protein